MTESQSAGDGANISLASGAIRRNLAVAYGLVADLYRHYPREAFSILAGGAASLGCQIVALGLLFIYVDALEAGKILHGQDPRESVGLFITVACSIGILFFGYALLEYRSNLATLRLCRSYQDIGARDAILLASRLPHWFDENENASISRRHLRRLLSVDVHHRSRMARSLLRVVVP